MTTINYEGTILAMAILVIVLCIGCADKPASTPPELAVITVQQENTTLKARVEALESLCKPFLSPEGLQATKNIQNASQAALQAQQQASSLGSQLNSIAVQANTVKLQADTLTQALNSSAVADKMKALQDQISTMQASILAIDQKINGIKIDNALYTMPKKWCKCSVEGK